MAKKPVKKTNIKSIQPEIAKLQAERDVRTNEAKRNGTFPYDQQKNEYGQGGLGASEATFFQGTPSQTVKFPTGTPQQQELNTTLGSRLPQAYQNLNLPGDKSSFEPIANEARRNFSQNALPTIAERYAGLGRNSSGLQQDLGGATAQFESQLAALQAQHGLQEQSQQSGNFFNSLSAFLQPQHDYAIQPGQESGVRQLWNSVQGPVSQASIAGVTGGLTGGLPGALAGFGGSLANSYLTQSQQEAIQAWKDNKARNDVTNGTGVQGNSAGFQ